jgi:hypothetical protein
MPGGLLRVDKFRALLARLIVQHLPRPRPLLIRAWLCLAADTDDVEEEWRGLWQVLELDPDNTTAVLAPAAPTLAKPDN